MVTARRRFAHVREISLPLVLAMLGAALSACMNTADASNISATSNVYVPGNPLQDHRIHRQITARLDEEPFFVTVNGNIYGFGSDNEAVPLVSVIGLWTYKLEDIDDGPNYISRRVYCGSFGRFGTEEILESYRNPITGQKVTVRKSQLENPDFFNTITPYGTFGIGKFSQVRVFPTDIERVPLRETRIVGREIRLIEERYNQELREGTEPWYEELSWTADLRDLVDGSNAFVPSSRLINVSQDASIRDWLHVDTDHTFITLHASGRKLASVDAIPANILGYVQENCPAHLDGTVWNKF